ncbi:MAG: glycine--tRNA ligase [Candidatus Uhrbacteria bacterium]|nr:glycine--tRNA ligase [Candidatus Uhrbacteria bacterium]
MSQPSMDTIVNLAKTRGFVFPGSDIYGGLANSWDYGPLGVELKNNIKHEWWKRFVHGRIDMVGQDGAIIMNPKVWEASGHLENFTDPLVECKNCHERYRADQIDLTKPCAKCGKSETLTEPASFNMMFKTFMGPKEESASTVYLRPETAQAIFVDFPQVLMTSRKRIPFGIAQIGKAFRNEITPGNFIFRTREFEQMEIEYFVHPDDWKEKFEMWLKELHGWIDFCGIKKEWVHEYETPGSELAHYSERTVDLEFDFPFGKSELYGLAYRTDHDLKKHSEYSGRDLSYTDTVTGEKYIPHVIEPSLGVDRTLLAVMLSAYTEEEAPTADGGVDKRVVMKFPHALAPIKIAVLPLSKKPELRDVALPIVEKLSKKWNAEYDETQSIGRRYRRQDEIGTPYCVTVDFDSLNDHAVTVRDRDTMVQERIAIGELEDYFFKNLKS